MQFLTQQYRLMGTVIDVSFYADNEEQANLIFQTVYEKLVDYERRFSANSDTSHLAKINQLAGQEAVHADKDLFDLIKIGKYHSCQPQSYLNVAIGPLVKLWRIGFKEARVPNSHEIESCLQIIDPENIILDEEKQSVFLAKEKMQLDLGALAKGYFADKILEYLKEQGIESAFINLGGNLLTMGPALHHEDGLWRIGIQDPTKPRGENITMLALRDKSVVTSGIYERYLVHNDQMYHHIISRRTGYPVENDIASLTIISQLSLDGEIWTTRLFGKDLPQVMGELAISEHLEGIVIDKSNRIYKSFSE